MAALADHKSSDTVKLLLIGDSTAGKTGALASLAAHGYQLRIIDLDNKIDVLKNYLTDSKSPYVLKNPNAAANVRVVTLTDEMRNVNGKAFPLRATVWSKTMSLLSDWIDPDDNTKLGKLSTWDTNMVLVIDSLSMLSDAALYFHLGMNGKLGSDRTQNEARRDIYQAQEKIKSLMELLRDRSVKCHVILITHVTAITEMGGKPKTDGDNENQINMGPPQGYPSTIGRAQSPKIPQYFPNMVILRATGTGAGTRRRLYTQSQMVGASIVNAMSSAPLRVAPEYDITWGLAEYFQALRGEANMIQINPGKLTLVKPTP